MEGNPQKQTATQIAAVGAVSSRSKSRKISSGLARLFGRKPREPQVVSRTDETRQDRDGPTDETSQNREGPNDETSQDREGPGGDTLWDRAYNALKEESPELVMDYETLLSKELQMQSISNPQPTDNPIVVDRANDETRQIHLAAIIEQGLKRMDQSRTQFTIAGHTFNIFLREQLSNAAGLAIWAKDWIGVAVKASPEASIVWAGVSVILPFLSNPKTADEANRDGFANVTTRIGYYAGLEPLLLRLCQHQEVSEKLKGEVQDAIVTLYRHILDFQIRSVLRFYSNGFTNSVRDIIGLDGWKAKLEVIQRLEATVREDLTQMNEMVSRQALDELNTSANKSFEVLGQFLSLAGEQLQVAKEQKDILHRQLQVQEDTLKQTLTDKEEECLQLFLLTTSDKDTTYEWYKSRVEPRIEDTCQWFLAHPHFKSWRDQDSGPLLVSADPGCGKSVLAKYLVDHELPRHGATTICYFFFKDQDQNTVRQALCALIHQLFSHQPLLIRHTKAEHQKMGAKLINSTESLWRIWKSATEDNECSPVTVVLDALDECLPSEFQDLIQKLQPLLQNGIERQGKIKYLLTSRPYDGIISEFRELEVTYPFIRIPGEDESETISKEIDHVVRHRVKRLAKKKRLSPAIANHLERRLLSIKHRTYLWTYLVFDHLKSSEFKNTEKGIDMTIIDTLPENVNQAYEKILSKCRDGPMVRKVLCIVLAAERPLTVDEMNVAVNIDLTARFMDDVDLEDELHFRSRLRSWCGLFVSVYNSRVYLLHQTAREFLVGNEILPISSPADESSLHWRQSITMIDAHKTLSEVCVTYLNMDDVVADVAAKGGATTALYEYAAHAWYFHFREAYGPSLHRLGYAWSSRHGTTRGSP
ncbi:hypothetical protein CONLIGDRAFT_481751 [Coniochaeta ligniaria NRRL 30616]|uniref:NWD NACHT-NTPase N-terminal domain-containing protein n=1 Tax=Coniochaeta ligniaria NRRL 30616 TaxID=1408157 RepID=A0A1J7IZV9_9PEZI|nr:hypothetical protein CONLIGDRAFT_481751 [Coniochaeta ligniaria NRRL 30616]